MSFNEITRDIMARKFNSVYFLAGEEPYFIDSIADLLELKVLSEADKSFNLSIFYGKDADAIQILNTCRRFPMAADYQLVLIKEAQELKSIDKFLNYLQKPVPTTILVFAYKGGKPDGRTEFGKIIKKNALYFESKTLYENQVPDWVKTYILDKGYKIDSSTAALIAEYLGQDLSKIANELDKLILGLTPGRMIDAALVESNIGISREFNVFELNNAIGSHDVLKSNRIIQNLSANPKDNPLLLILGSLVSYFTKLLVYHDVKSQGNAAAAAAIGVNPFFLKQYETAAGYYTPQRIMKIIGKLRIADLASKGVDCSPETTDADLLKELMFHILH